MEIAIPVTPENIVNQMRELMSSGSRGEELSIIVGEQMNPAQLFSPTIVHQRGLYSWLWNVLEAGGIITLFEDHSNRTPVAHRIIRAIWPSRETELINLLGVNGNVVFAFERNGPVNPDRNIRRKDGTRTDQGEEQTHDW